MYSGLPWITPHQIPTPTALGVDSRAYIRFFTVVLQGIPTTLDDAEVLAAAAVFLLCWLVRVDAVVPS